VATARKSLLGKAKEKPDQVKQVLNSVKIDSLGRQLNVFIQSVEKRK